VTAVKVSNKKKMLSLILNASNGLNINKFILEDLCHIPPENQKMIEKCCSTIFFSYQSYDIDEDSGLSTVIVNDSNMTYYTFKIKNTNLVIFNGLTQLGSACSLLSCTNSLMFLISCEEDYVKILDILSKLPPLFLSEDIGIILLFYKYNGGIDRMTAILPVGADVFQQNIEFTSLSSICDSEFYFSAIQSIVIKKAITNVGL